MTTRDTPEAELAAALASPDVFGWLRDDDRIGEFDDAYFGRKVKWLLAALDGWALNRIEVVPGLERIVLDQTAEIARLRAALLDISTDRHEESHEIDYDQYCMNCPDAGTLMDKATRALASDGASSR
jgi:hypothetical protein